MPSGRVRLTLGGMMRRRNFLSFLSALAPAAILGRQEIHAMSRGAMGKPALHVTPEAMKAAWQSIAWGGYSGQAMTIDVGLPWRLLAWENGQFVPWWEIDSKLCFFSEWLETYGTRSSYDYEPISDKANRYTHVEITELGPARVVLHWEYALCDATRHAGIFHGNTWAEEFHTVYPDGLTVRKLVAYPGSQSTAEGEPRFWEVAEIDLIFAPPSTLNETITKTPLRVTSTSGHSYALPWPSTGDPWFCRRNPKVSEWPAYIFRAGLKNRPEPYLIVPNRKDYFPRRTCPLCEQDHPCVLLWLSPHLYKHYPGFKGEYEIGVEASEADMKTHPVSMPLVSVLPWVHKFYFEPGDHSSRPLQPEWSPAPGTTWLMLWGTSDQGDEHIENVARQWLNPAVLKMTEGENAGFEPAENLYQVHAGRDRCEFTLAADSQAPVVHPSFKILDWGYRPAQILIDGKILSPEQWRGTWNRKDLIVWIDKILTAPARIRFETF
ncbi:MAG: hypothetical protein LAP13_23030 [Acidobacteriia bacterium]|nr:hypothetical protein [Terriglobia bacterium]